MFGKRQRQPALDLSQLSSLIAEDVEIVGDLHFTRGLRIDGRVRGHVKGRAPESPSAAKGGSLLVLSDKGCIDGSVHCCDAVINGTVNGDLVVEQFLELQSGARVSGTIRYRQLQMDVGASVQGQLQRIGDEPPAAKVVELVKDKPADKAVAAR